jgi:hypothetical protein
MITRLHLLPLIIKSLLLAVFVFSKHFRQWPQQLSSLVPSLTSRGLNFIELCERASRRE